VVLVCADFYKLVSLLYRQAYLLQRWLNFWRKNNPAILGPTHNVIHQNRNMVTLIKQLAHALITSEKQRRGKPRGIRPDLWCARKGCHASARVAGRSMTSRDSSGALRSQNDTPDNSCVHTTFARPCQVNAAVLYFANRIAFRSSRPWPGCQGALYVGEAGEPQGQSGAVPQLWDQ